MSNNNKDNSNWPMKDSSNDDWPATTTSNVNWGAPEVASAARSWGSTEDNRQFTVLRHEDWKQHLYNIDILPIISDGVVQRWLSKHTVQAWPFDDVIENMKKNNHLIGNCVQCLRMGPLNHYCGNCYDKQKVEVDGHIIKKHNNPMFMVTMDKNEWKIDPKTIEDIVGHTEEVRYPIELYENINDLESVREKGRSPTLICWNRQQVENERAIISIKDVLYNGEEPTENLIKMREKGILNTEKENLLLTLYDPRDGVTNIVLNKDK